MQEKVAVGSLILHLMSLGRLELVVAHLAQVAVGIHHACVELKERGTGLGGAITQRLREPSCLMAQRKRGIETVAVAVDGGALVARISGTSLEKEPTATDVLCKLPGMMKNKDM